MLSLRYRAIPAHLREVIEPACESFERAWKEGRRPVIEDQLAPIPEAARPLLAAELLRIELEWRFRRRERPIAEEYRPRFPALAPALGDWLDEAGAAAGRKSWETPDTADTGHASPRHREPSPPDGAPCLPRVLGEYELGKELGGGGMGVVYRACHRRLGKPVALKLLPIHSRHSAEAVARFLREMKVVGGLKHPHVVEAHDAGEAAGVVYLAMELLEGVDLEQWVEQRGPLPVAEACDLTRQAALGLDYMHGRGLVHRDVKPSNLMRTAEGVVKVLDLGLARWRQEAAAGELTGTGQGMGTPDYLAPEQAQDAATADGRADLYGLGGTLFYLLTGLAPFAHRTGLYEKLDAHRGETAPDVRSLRPEVPVALAELVQRLLAKDPQDRPQTAAEVAAALAAFAASMSSCPPLPPEAPVLASKRARRRHGWLAAGLLLAALLGLGACAWLGRPTPTPSAPLTISDEATPQGAESGPKPLTVSLRVFRLSPNGGFNARLLGELGGKKPGDPYRVCLEDRVRFETELSEPAHAYLIGFNPTDKVDDQEQPIPANAADRLPDKRDKLPPGRWLRLNDGEGLQAFALVASRQPLPAYSEWRKRRPPLPWKRAKALSGVVWLGDGETVRGLTDQGINRAPEEAEADDGRMILELMRALRTLPGVDAVSVVGFAVDRAE